MKYIKQYEENTQTPERGDYVACKLKYVKYNSGDKLNVFIDNNIGKIIDDEGVRIGDPSYFVRYENVPDDLKSRFMYYNRTTIIMEPREILFFDKSKEKLKLKVATNKYNL